MRRLPFANGASIPQRDGTVWGLLESWGIHLRPSLSLGLQAHRAGPSSSGRQVSGRLALQSHGGSGPDVAGLNHAALPVALDPEVRDQLPLGPTGRPSQDGGSLSGWVRKGRCAEILVGAGR